MDERFIRERITQLRMQKGISEYKMSYELGHSRGYINNISSGKALPSMGEFIAICDYFGITPIEFFDGTVNNPHLFREVSEQIKLLDSEDLELVKKLLNRLIEKEKQS